MRLTEIEQARKNTLKVVRAAVRLRHSIKADDELNERLFVAEKAFDKAIANGFLPDPISILDAIGEKR